MSDDAMACDRCGRPVHAHPLHPGDGLCFRCRSTLKRNPDAKLMGGKPSIRLCDCGTEMVYAGFGHPPTRCDACKREQGIAKQRAARQRRKEHFIPYYRAWRQQNRDKISAQKAHYYRENKEKCDAAHRAWYLRTSPPSSRWKPRQLPPRLAALAETTSPEIAALIREQYNDDARGGRYAAFDPRLDRIHPARLRARP